METVRDGQKVWPYCSRCGCRLQLSYLFKEKNTVIAYHYYGSFDTDSRGHKCKSVFESHYVSSESVQDFEIIDFGF